jgi:hypothetical protein
MKITIRQSGGFAGTNIDLAAVNVETLPTLQQGGLRKAVQDSGFFALPGRLGGSEVGADLATYEITVEDDARRHTVRFVDDGSPETSAVRRLRDAVLGAA